MGDYGTAHDISEVIMQADVTIKKLVRTCVIFGSERKKSIAPNQRKKKTWVPTHLKQSVTHCLHGQKSEVWSPFLMSRKPIFLSCKQAFCYTIGAVIPRMSLTVWNIIRELSSLCTLSSLSFFGTLQTSPCSTGSTVNYLLCPLPPFSVYFVALHWDCYKS